MITEAILPWLGLIIGGYFLGSVMFSRVICLFFFHTDICKVSKDKNPGAANAFWHCGKVAGVSGLLLDMLKGFLPVFIAIKYLDCSNPALILVVLAPVLGHAFSVFHGFSGGKCIATIYGVLTAFFVTLLSPWFLVILGILNILFEYFKKITGDKRAYIMFSILITYAIFNSFYYDQIPISFGVILISLLSILKHSSLFATSKNKADRSKKASLTK